MRDELCLMLRLFGTGIRPEKTGNHENLLRRMPTAGKELHFHEEELRAARERTRTVLLRVHGVPVPEIEAPG